MKDKIYKLNYKKNKMKLQDIKEAKFIILANQNDDPGEKFLFDILDMNVADEIRYDAGHDTSCSRQLPSLA